MNFPKDALGLQVRGLRKGFGSDVLIDDATFSVGPGEVVCLTGDNGAGKSTLLRCLVGLSRYSGEVSLRGMKLNRGSMPPGGIGYVPQAPALVETATVAETLSFFASLRGVDPDLGSLPDDLLPPLDDKIGILSGGQRQRVALAIGFLGAPDLLLLDEPTANLDDEGRAMVKHLIARDASGGASVVIVSPAVVDLTTIVDRVLMLRGGRIVPCDINNVSRVSFGTAVQAHVGPTMVEVSS